MGRQGWLLVAALILGIFLGVWLMVGGGGGTVWGWLGIPSARASTLYQQWKTQMEQLATLTQGPYPSGKLERMRLAGQIEAANDRAAGMAYLAASLGDDGQTSDMRLAGSLDNVNFSLDTMLEVIETGYNGASQSQLNPRDLAFAHRVIVHDVLARLPASLKGFGATDTAASRLNAVSLQLNTLTRRRFSKHG